MTTTQIEETAADENKPRENHVDLGNEFDDQGRSKTLTVFSPSGYKLAGAMAKRQAARGEPRETETKCGQRNGIK